VSSKDGTVCMDILSDEWTPALNVRSTLISVQSLLSAPEPDNPINFIAAEESKLDKTNFEAKVKE